MKLTKIFSTIAFLSLQLGCISQQSKNVDFSVQDQLLANVYDKYYENRLDYGDSYGEARDTILIRFRETLLKVISDKESISHSFDSLNSKIKIIVSEDQKLRIFSWDELNGGTWHIYNSIFQYKENEMYSFGDLKIVQKTPNSSSYSDVAYVHIDKLSDTEYLLKGYGTHGGGQDFYVFRKITFKNNQARDCDRCFNGENQLLFIKPRADKTSPVFKSSSNTIELPEYKENENTGFLEKTGNTITHSYKNGNFIKTE
ncbi:hypothetical protein [Aquimarina sp. 2201CG14-23]|uniref:hypothetical protein n=1 Tax=Aquimarina mycalae TaxID=3040073 RepID=UPI00247819CA|nr:hypothetical protein [Aquimarina sp. 2201CG14-23]MDH7446806.1 hypothetical protein [Aquimarina sp. 2201CG14-23]